MKFRVGTRGSQLSIAQTNWVISELKKKNPEHEFEIITIKTKGDSDARPLFTINQKGIFEKEIDLAVEEKKVEFAVHSLKDVPSEISEKLVIASIPKREFSNDVLVTKDGTTLDSLKAGSVVGTSSLRRAVQVSRKSPDVIVKPVRGNIETRIKKMQDGLYDAVVLAEAGISRLGLDVKFSRLSHSDFAPSPGQGALAIICRKDDVDTVTILKKIEDEKSRCEIEAERALSQFIDSGCRFPVGALATLNDKTLRLNVTAYSVDGKRAMQVVESGNYDNPSVLGKNAGEKLKKQGVDGLAIEWRQKVEEWNKT